ncbi:UNVERIFIED_CONTAM: hypothetical protein HDU68_000260 [Siphonaria sp. JEL0065]|nr:hypothetical protein HDU68_000260 [Siphonaria sp. JEL0065]
MVWSDELQAYIADVVLPSSLESGEKIMYKFIVDGEWKTASEEPTEFDPSGNVNNVYVITKMTRQTQSPTPADDSIPHLRTSTGSISEESEGESASETPFNSSFNLSPKYNPQPLIDLSAFLVEHLDSVPFYVDRTRIFHCVKDCYLDFKRESSFGKDPERFNLVLFLLGAARASHWFSEAQLAFIREWTKDLSEAI